MRFRKPHLLNRDRFKRVCVYTHISSYIDSNENKSVCIEKNSTMPHIYTAIILICLHISMQHFSVNGIALENSIDSIADQFNYVLDPPYSTETDYNSSNLLNLPNLVSSFSTFFNGKSNKPVSKLCNLNTVSFRKLNFYSWKSDFFWMSLDKMVKSRLI